MKEAIILGSGMADLGAAHRDRERGVPALIYTELHTSHTNMGWPVFMECVGAQ